MAKTNEYLDEAYQELMQLSADDIKRLEYEAREKALRDYNSQMSSARKMGIEQGVAKGKISGIKALIETCQELGADREDTVLRLQNKFQLTQEEALKYMKEYWN